MKKIFLFVSIGITILAIPLTVFLVGRNQEIRKKAAPATTLSLSPVLVTQKVGETFTMDVKIDTGTNQVGTIQVRIEYDASKLKAEDITNGALAPTIRASGKIDQAGVATITVGARDATHPITGTGTVAVVIMKAIAATTTPITITAPISGTFANAIGEGQTNVLTGTTGATVTILNTDGSTAAAGQPAGFDAPAQQQSQTTPTPTPTPVVIAFGGSQGNAYTPSDITIKPGQSVSWQGNFVSHPLASADNLWTAIKTGSEFSHTFESEGVFVYYCQLHGSPTTGMKGKITVSEDIVATLTPTLVPTQAATQSGTASSSAQLAITAPLINAQSASDKPTFTGTAPPGSTVTITIHSETQTVVVTADANGNWSYTPQTALDPGPHTVDVLVTDATTGSTQTASVPFVVAGAIGGGDASGSAIPISGNTNATLVFLLLGSLLLMAGALLPILRLPV